MTSGYHERLHRLTTLPIAFSQLQKLTSLDLQRNRFSAIPDCIFDMKSLTVLLLQKNRITSISPKIAQCIQLVSLNLSYNRLQKLPVEMAECRSLKHLLLSVNQIQTLPTVLCEAWVNLLNLDMHTNDLKMLPDQLGSMRSLRRLNLAINKIEDVPASIGQLQMLEWLNLNDNKLVTLPETMDQMQKLVKMGIVQNKLQTLPSSLAKLSVLYKLDCRRNEIEYLPSAFKDMQAIHSLLLEENPLNYKYGVSNYDRQPVTLLEMATRAVLERYSPQNQRDHGKGYLASDGMCLSPDSMYSSDMSDVTVAGQDANLGMGISHLLPAMADLGLTRASTLPAPEAPITVTTPQKSRYSFFSRACSTVHPSRDSGHLSKPARSSTLTSTHSSDASSSDASSTSHSASSSSSSTPSTNSPSSVTSPSSTSLASSLPCNTSTPGSFLTTPADNLRRRPSRQKSSPRSLKPPSIFRRHSSRHQREQSTAQQQQQQQQLDRALVRPLISPIQAEIVHTPQEETLAAVSPETYPKAPQPPRRRRHVTKMERLLDPETSLLPIPLIDLLSMPTTVCDHCHRRMFTSGWISFLEPVKLGANSRTIVPIRHQLCSLKCVRWQYRDSFGSEMVETFEQTEFHLSQNGDLIGTRPILPEEMDEVMIEAVQEAAEHAGISITHILEQFSQHNQQQNRGQRTGTSSSSSPTPAAVASSASSAASTSIAYSEDSTAVSESTAVESVTAEPATTTVLDSVPGVPGSITIAAVNRMVPSSDPSSITHSLPPLPPTTATLTLPTPGSILRQTTARIRRSLSRPMTPIEIQVDAHGQLRRIIYRQSRPTHPSSVSNNNGQQTGPGTPNNGNAAAAVAGGGSSHRRRLLDTFRSLSQVGHGGLAAGLGTGGGGGIGGGAAMGMAVVSAAAAADGIPQNHGGAGGIAAAQAVAARAAGEVMNVTTFSAEFERF